MKTFRVTVYVILVAVVVGLIAYQAFIEKNPDSDFLTKALLVLAGIIFSAVRPHRKRKVRNKKQVYSKAYPDLIQDPFCDDKKLERQFYQAVDDYNRNKSAAGIKKLDRLRKECQRTSDLFSVTVFTALCYDDMKLYHEAIVHYTAAARIRASSTVYSNMGLCCYRLGKYREAEEAYRQAIRLDPKNAYAYTNLASIYFSEGDYAESLRITQQAIQLNQKLVQALSKAAVCCALLGQDEAYQKYYRQAVSNGYDGNKIKETVAKLKEQL